jgi:hypothetical protein
MTKKKYVVWTHPKKSGSDVPHLFPTMKSAWVGYRKYKNSKSYIQIERPQKKDY